MTMRPDAVSDDPEAGRRLGTVRDRQRARNVTGDPVAPSLAPIDGRRVGHFHYRQRTHDPDALPYFVATDRRSEVRGEDVAILLHTL